MRQTHWCKMQKAPYLKLRDLRLNDVIFLRFEAPWQMNYECYFIKLNKTRASKLFLRYFDELILITASNENEEKLPIC